MRISDWSSYVCSSDLEDAGEGAVVVDELDFLRELLVLVNGGHVEIDGGEGIEVDRRTAFIGAPGADAAESPRIRHLDISSEARRVGKECVSTCSSLVSPYP